MNTKGIDISHWNGNINFDLVKSAGYDFVIIKAGGYESGPYIDPMFEINYNKAKNAGLNVGCYYFAGKNFRTAEVGTIYVDHFYSLIKGKEFEYPVFIDVEAQDVRYRNGITDAVVNFSESLEKMGYFVGVYASDISGYKDRLIHDKIKKFAHWVARYGREPQICKDYQIWQYSSKGSVRGIIGSVDLDISNVDYPKIIKSKGLNGFSKPKTGIIKKRKTKED